MRSNLAREQERDRGTVAGNMACLDSECALRRDIGVGRQQGGRLWSPAHEGRIAFQFRVLNWFKTILSETNILYCLPVEFSVSFALCLAFLTHHSTSSRPLRPPARRISVRHIPAPTLGPKSRSCRPTCAPQLLRPLRLLLTLPPPRLPSSPTESWPSRSPSSPRRRSRSRARTCSAAGSMTGSSV